MAARDGFAFSIDRSTRVGRRDTYEVTGPFTGTNFWIGSETGCVGANGPPPSLVEVGAEVVPSDEFATVASVM